MPHDRAHLAPRHVAVAGDVVDAGRRRRWSRTSTRRTTSSSCTNCTRGSKPRISGTTGRRSAIANGVSRSSPSTLAKRKQRDVDVRVVVGEVAKERLDLEQRPLDAACERAPCASCPRGRSTGRTCAAPYTRPELFSTTLRTGLPAAPAAASRFMVPITLISCSVRLARSRRVDDEVRVHDRVDLRRRARCARGSSDDESVRTNSVRSSGIRGIVRVDADDDLDVGPPFERLRDTAAPIRRKSGDEYAHCRGYPNHTLRRVRSMS